MTLSQNKTRGWGGSLCMLACVACVYSQLHTCEQMCKRSSRLGQVGSGVTVLGPLGSSGSVEVGAEDRVSLEPR